MEEPEKIYYELASKHFTSDENNFWINQWVTSAKEAGYANVEPPVFPNNKVTIEVTPDLTTMAEQIKTLGDAFYNVAEKMGGEYILISDAFIKFYYEVKDLLVTPPTPGNPADAVITHPDMSTVFMCPDKACLFEDPDYFSLDRLIIHLNDRHKWTREHIADWLDTLPSQPIFYPQIEETPNVEGRTPDLTIVDDCPF